MHAILSYHINSTFSLLSNVTFFLFPLFFLLSTHYSNCISYCAIVFSIFMDTVLIYTITQSMLFLPFYPYLHQPFWLLQAFIHSTYFPLSSDRVQLDTIPPRCFSLCLMTKDPPILDKDQSAAKPPPLSLSQKWQKLPLILCLHSLACIRWFSPTFPFLVKIPSQQGKFPKVGSAGYQLQVFPLPPPPTTPSTPHRLWVLLSYMAGMQKGKTQTLPYSPALLLQSFL